MQNSTQKYPYYGRRLTPPRDVGARLTGVAPAQP